jgi:hypothetical protein
MKWGESVVWGLVLGLCLANLPAAAQEAGVKLSKDELLQLMPGQKVMHVSKAGNTRHWTNEADGSLFASWAPIITGSGKFGGSAKGTWNISEDGRYCVKIDWQRSPEKWCRFIFRTGSDYTMAASDDPTVEREKLGLQK